MEIVFPISINYTLFLFLSFNFMILDKRKIIFKVQLIDKM